MAHGARGDRGRGADLLSKAWALGSEPTTSTTGLVQLRHVTNSGASFGWGEQIPAVVLALAVVASVAVGWWWAKASGPVERVAVAAILGGAFGNLADVAIRGGLVAALVAREVHHCRTRRAVWSIDDGLAEGDWAGWKVLTDRVSATTRITGDADLTVATGCGQLTSGAPARGERVAKYNRLLAIAASTNLPYGLA